MAGSKIFLCIWFALVGSVSALYSQTAQQKVIAVRAGRLFDSKTGRLLAKQVIVLQGDRIREIGTEDKTTIPTGAQVVDLS